MIKEAIYDDKKHNNIDTKFLKVTLKVIYKKRSH